MVFSDRFLINYTFQSRREKFKGKFFGWPNNFVWIYIINHKFQTGHLTFLLIEIKS